MIGRTKFVLFALFKLLLCYGSFLLLRSGRIRDVVVIVYFGVFVLPPRTGCVVGLMTEMRLVRLF